MARAKWDMERSAVEADLRHWGRRYQRILCSDGFSSYNIFANLLMGSSGRKGHKVLIPDMDKWAWEVNHRVWAITPRDYAWALVARYALPPRDEDGQLYSPAEIALALGWKPSAYKWTVVKARRRYQKLLFA